MAYQVPKSDHPWRRYQNRQPEQAEEKEDTHIRSVKTVVHELCESWENIEVTTISGSRKYLAELPQSKQAVWLINFIKKSYVQY